jgi:hypothetical protein
LKAKTGRPIRSGATHPDSCARQIFGILVP